MAPESNRLEIVFSHRNNVYRAGCVLSGYVSLDLDHDIKIKGVRLELHGSCRVHWDETRAYTKGSARRLSHNYNEVCLDDTKLLSTKTELIKAGHHRWPFNVHLNISLPETFEGRWGRVQYWAKATVERPWKSNLDVTRSFSVLGCLDLNNEPDAKHRIENDDVINTGMACCGSGFIRGVLSLQHRGFAPGEMLTLSAAVKNKSRSKLSARVVFSQITIFRAGNKSRRHTSILQCLNHGEITAGEEISWQDAIDPVPNLPPSRLGCGSKNIDIKYILTLVAVQSGPGKDLEVPIEVLIGTIPLHNKGPVNHQNHSRHSCSHQQHVSTTEVLS